MRIAVESIADKWLAHDAKFGFTLFVKSNQCCPARHSNYKRARAIDRVEYPGQAGGTLFFPIFLTNDSVSWISLLDELADGSFARLVTLGHGVPGFVVLDIDGGVLAKMRQDLSGGSACKCQSEIGEFCPMVSHSGALIGRQQLGKCPTSNTCAALQHETEGMFSLHGYAGTMEDA